MLGPADFGLGGDGSVVQCSAIHLYTRLPRAPVQYFQYIVISRARAFGDPSSGLFEQRLGILAQDIFATARLVRLARARRWRGYVQRSDGVVRVLTAPWPVPLVLQRTPGCKWLPGA